MGRIRLALILLLFVVQARATTVTLTLLDPTTAATNKNAYVRFELKNYGRDVPRVTGTNIILPSFKDLYPDVNGLVTGTIIGNDIIIPANTYYSVGYFKNGVRFYFCEILITGVSMDLDNASCLQTGPPAPAPVTECFNCPAGPTGATGPTGPPGPAGGALCTDLTQVTNLYVNYNTGNDTTGNGTSGLPWKTIQKAIDAGIPGIVCGRYIIHLQVATTYIGQVNLAGRIFAGGGTTYLSDTFWPFSNDPATGIDDDAWPYSWIEIVGDTANTSTYIIQQAATFNSNFAAISQSYANLTLRGVTVANSGYGVLMVGGYLNLAGVKFLNNATAVEAGFHAHVHIDATGTVDDDFTNVVSIISTVPGAVPVIPSFGFDIHDQSILSTNDSQNSGPSQNYNINIDDTAAAFHGWKGIRLMSGSTANIWMNIVCNMGGSSDICLEMFDSTASLNNNIDATGIAAGSSTAIRLIDSHVDAQNAPVTLTNWIRGLYILGDSTWYAAGAPTFVTVTEPYFILTTTDGSFVIKGQVIHGIVATLKETLTFSATPAFNMRHGGYKKITLTNNVTSSTVTNPSDGQELTFEICQDGVGGRTFAWPADVRGEEAIGATLSTCSTQKFIYDSGAVAWLALSPMVKNQ